MRRTSIAAALAFCALPLLADQQATAAATSTQAPVVVDSPLVAAAKASSRNASKSKKKIVITNETLVRSGGHVTTPSSKQPALPAPQTPLVDEATKRSIAAQQTAWAAKQAAEAKAKAEKEEQQKRAMQRAAQVAEGDYEEAPPVTSPNDPNLTAAEREMIQKTLTPAERELVEKVTQEEAKKPPF